MAGKNAFARAGTVAFLGGGEGGKGKDEISLLSK